MKKVKQHLKDKYILFGVIALIVLILDQVAKYFVKLTPLSSKHVLVEGWLSFSHVHNFGASFGMLQNQTSLLIWFSIIVIAGIFFYLHEIPQKYIPWLGLILGGTLGNLVDRISYGFVIDFLSIAKWPDFNIADVAISVGALVLAWVIAREKN
tara:strand:+ start:180 stop:638 length:459 start_codon:yes stop_codon:yes gene_type:complete